MTDAEIDHKWAEFLAIEGHKFHLEQKGVKPDEVARLAAEFERSLVAKRTWGR